MPKQFAYCGIALTILLAPVPALSQGGFAGQPVPTAMADEMSSTMPINTHTGGYQGGFGGGAWHPDSWHSGDVGGTWHGDGWHAGGTTAGGFHGPAVVNNYYNQGCTSCSGAPQPTALQSSFNESLPISTKSGDLYATPPSNCTALDNGDHQCGDTTLRPYYGNNGVYYRNEGTK